MNDNPLSTEQGLLSHSLFAKIIDSNRSTQAAIQFENQILSYGDLTHLINETAQQLVHCGLETGDRILIVFPNCAEHIIAVLAVLSLGAVVVPISPDAPERLARIRNEINPRICLVHSNTALPNYDQTHQLQVNFSRKSISLSPGSEVKLGAGVSGLTAITENSESFIRYSSGSTGEPKGAILNHGHLIWTAQTLSSIFDFDQQHRELLIAPIAYSGGWQRVTATLYCGGCIVIPHGSLSVAGILEDIETQKITGFFTPPPMVRMLLASNEKHARKVLSRCRTIEIGSAPISASELKKFLTLAPNAQIFVHYGMTECSRAVVLDARNNLDKLATVGKPAPGVELMIVGDDGQNLNFGKTGEIFLKGPQQATAYWKRHEFTKERFIDGWIATGDYGSLDEQGFLTYLGRRDDMINCGGYSFFPAEIETELGELEGVKHYLIAGVPDPRGILEQIPWAFVVPVDSKNYALQTFLSQARKRLSPHKVPRWVVTMPVLPVTPTGKPDRRRAVQIYASETKN